MSSEIIEELPRRRYVTDVTVLSGGVNLFF